ncbi:MAG: pyruvate kinase, partial [Dehalococcoidia bacterium]
MPRRTKILATVGPASHDKATIRALIEAGVDAFRLNFSYGDQDEHARAAELIREASRQLRRPVAILQDLQGPKIRVGRLVDGPYELAAGTEVTIATRDATGDRTRIPIRVERLSQEVRAGDRVFLGDGEVELKVVAARDGEIVAQVVEGGTLKENLGVHVPGV